MHHMVAQRFGGWCLTRFAFSSALSPLLGCGQSASRFEGANGGSSAVGPTGVQPWSCVVVPEPEAEPTEDDGGCTLLPLSPELRVELVPEQSLDAVMGGWLEVCVDGQCSVSAPFEQVGQVYERLAPFGEPLTDTNADPNAPTRPARAYAYLELLRGEQVLVGAVVEPTTNYGPEVALEVRLFSPTGEIWIDHRRLVDAPLLSRCYPVSRGRALIAPDSPSDLTCGSAQCVFAEHGWDSASHLVFEIPSDIDTAIVCRGLLCTNLLRPGYYGAENMLESMRCAIPGSCPKRIECQDHVAVVPPSESYTVKLFRGGKLAAEVEAPVTYTESYANQPGCDPQPCRSATLDLR